ncbi:hypothetical protein [Alteraurantiacibacter aquimixticola]|uniref:hypothetical protein n=1 Tax=Alteraurantiacibacter aquimixticola TaxID=2489173 RepID=UPI001FE64FD8|nr:hypothetical protein [Alteraurantiacibacter aquimixticola]
MISFAQEAPRNFLFLGGDDPEDHAALLQREDIEGAQVVYNWRGLEPSEGEYDFAAIERDLATLEAFDRELFVQLQDRFFLPQARWLPDYLLEEEIYAGGLARQADTAGEGPDGSGWVAMQWQPALRARFQALLDALAERFDGRIAGINLPETSTDLDLDNPPPGFSCDSYFAATMENLAHARQAFAASPVVQYVNFWPCEWDNDHDYMGRIFAMAEERQIGLGGPDIVPHRRAQEKNSYPFFNAYRERLPLVAMAVQQPTLTYIDPQTGEPFTRAAITAYAQDHLGVDVIFWTIEAPWLQENGSQ